MTTATLPRTRKKKATEPEYKFGQESNGTLMTPQEFDNADPDDFDPLWDYELINGVLVVSPIPLEEEADPNEELGHMLRTDKESHPLGNALNKTLQERYVKCGRNRRKPDRLIWAGLGRHPRRGEKPTIIVEFVSSRKRDRDRDYVAKRTDYEKIRVQEYWIIDRFEKTMTAHILVAGKFRKKVLDAGQPSTPNCCRVSTCRSPACSSWSTSGAISRKRTNHENQDRRQRGVRTDGQAHRSARR
jgi:Uma2 family endonuclease